VSTSVEAKKKTLAIPKVHCGFTDGPNASSPESAQWWPEGNSIMADRRLPVVLQILRISIDPSGELAVGSGSSGSALRQPTSVLRDSRGRSYLLFETSASAKAAKRPSALSARPEWRWYGIAMTLLWLLGAASVLAALRWGTAFLTS
jgi:hypothetical protein